MYPDMLPLTLLFADLHGEAGAGEKG